MTDTEAERIRRDVERILDEWRDTMAGDPKFEAVARGMSMEIRAALEDPR